MLFWTASSVTALSIFLVILVAQFCMLGKVLGFQNNVVNIALSLPLAIAGPLTDWLGLREVLWGLSASVTLLGVRVSQKNRDRRQAAARLESLPSDRPGQQSLKPVARSLDTDSERN